MAPAGTDDMFRTHHLVRLEAIALVGVGGFAGATVRSLVVEATWPVAGVLAVNVLGCLFLGFLLSEAHGSGLVSRRAQLVLATGFTSSLTTYSTFALHVALAPSPLAMVGVIVANYGLGFLAVLLGRECARRVAFRAGTTGVEG